MLTFAVSEEKNRWLRQKMQELNVREEELEEQFIRSSGRGGQHVNKSSTAVQLRHRPTGTMVTCMQDRSQSINRFLARRELLEKLELLLKGESPRSNKAERSRKQKARRKRRSEAKYDVTPSGHEEPEKG
ncbi:MAG TPA: peptide chain release factor-like protein [Geobacterales bacterium]|nr:peptide chain release factor-like protein [Geobacterales bacterium]